MSTEIASTSPTGRYVIRVFPWGVRMSHWIETPELLDTHTNTILIRFTDPNWSLETATWKSDTVVTLSLRRYPGDHTPSSFEATVDCQRQTATIGQQALLLTRFERVLEHAYALGRRSYEPV